MDQASSHLQTLGVCLEKPRSSCRAPGAKVVLPFSGCFGWQLPPKEKNHPCPSPPILWALHIRGLRLLCGLRVGSHPWSIPLALLPFQLILQTRAGLEGPMSTGKQQPHPKVSLSLRWCSPAAFLPPCLPSWQPAPAWSQESRHPGLPFGHPRLSPRHKHTLGHLLVVLPFPPCPLYPWLVPLLSCCGSHGPSMPPTHPSPANPSIPGSQAASHPHLPSVPASSVSPTLRLPICPGIGLTFAALNSASAIHPLPSLLVNSFASPADAWLRESSAPSCSAARAVPGRCCSAGASLLQWLQ